jgi:hypothetical protein
MPQRPRPRRCVGNPLIRRRCASPRRLTASHRWVTGAPAACPALASPRTLAAATVRYRRAVRRTGRPALPPPAPRHSTGRPVRPRRPHPPTAEAKPEPHGRPQHRRLYRTTGRRRSQRPRTREPTARRRGCPTRTARRKRAADARGEARRPCATTLDAAALAVARFRAWALITGWAQTRPDLAAYCAELAITPPRSVCQYPTSLPTERSTCTNRQLAVLRCRTHRAENPDSPCRKPGLTVPKTRTHRVENPDSPCRDAGLTVLNSRTHRGGWVPCRALRPG